MEEAGGVMRVGRGTNCPGEGDICTESSRKRSSQSVTPRRTPTRPKVKAEAGRRSREGLEGGQDWREARAGQKPEGRDARGRREVMRRLIRLKTKKGADREDVKR